MCKALAPYVVKAGLDFQSSRHLPPKFSDYREEHSHQAPQFETTLRGLSSICRQMTPGAIYVTLLAEHSSTCMYHNEVSGKFPCLSKPSAPGCISLTAPYFLQKPPGDLTLPTPGIYKQTHPNTLGNLNLPSLFNIHLQFILSKMLFAWNNSS